MVADEANTLAGEQAVPRLFADGEAIAAARLGRQLAAFSTRLFARAAPEDVLQYKADELAEFAASTWEFLAERKPRTPNVRIWSPSAGERLKDISVVEIVNDDMPFLLDSVLGELADRGVDTYLVAHPIFGVMRDA